VSIHPSWYWNRLRVMGPAEVVAKAGQRLWIGADYHRVARSPRRSMPQCGRWDATADAGDCPALVARALEMRDGEWVFLSTRDSAPSDWHRDPVTGIRIPCDRSWRLNTRDPNLVGSVKTVWEKSRHQHLQTLAAAHWLTREEGLAEVVGEQLISWGKSNPYLSGANWSSGIEIALRMVSWVWIERFLRGTSQHDLLFGSDGALWDSMYLSQRFLRHTLSSGSSANNHLIAELLGVFVVAAALPVWEGGTQTAEWAWERFQAEVLRQTWSGGFSREQAVGYHLFVTEMALVALLEARRSGLEPSVPFERRVRAMVSVAAELHSTSGHRADFGDADDSQVLGFLSQGRARFPAVTALGCLAAGASARGVFVTDEEWAVARLAMGTLDAAESVSEVGTLRDCGIVKLSRETCRGTMDVWFDAAPLGMSPLAAHGHADALSFVVHIGGVPVFVDSGTYEFGLHPEWRAYFRGSRAHNVVTVDRLDQSVQSGAFGWATIASAMSETPTTGGGWVAGGAHDGYKRIPGVGLVHRHVELTQDGLGVLDRVDGTGLHEISTRLHFGPETNVSLDGPIALVEVDGLTASIALEASLSWQVLRGDEAEGWHSERFGEKTPAPVLVGSAEVFLPWEGRCTLVVR
jgi:hypothetical protein